MLSPPSLPFSGSVLLFTPRLADTEANCRSGRPIHFTGRLVNNQRGPATTLDCAGDWARCRGSQSYLLTEISIQIYSAATAAIPTVISQSLRRHAACLSSLCPSVFISHRLACSHLLGFPPPPPSLPPSLPHFHSSRLKVPDKQK